LNALAVLPLESPVDQIYGAMRANLESREKLIGPNNLLIAAHAFASDAVLVTDNQREFERVKGLKLENWLTI
jgi:tRNA(fMet)-specific endonuclease VapC